MARRQGDRSLTSAERLEIRRRVAAGEWLIDVAAATGRNPAADLFWLYSLLPLAVAFVAEQFRIASAQSVLDTRGLTDAKAMARLPDAEQRSVVLAIVRREIGVMALAAVVAVFLVLRAAATF